MSLPGPLVRVIYRKFDGSLHWHMTLGRLGEDEYGTWLGALAGFMAQRGDDAPVVFEQACVTLIPSGSRWWTMNCLAPGGWTELYLDITTVPRWIVLPTGEDAVEMVDLDLDVIRRWDGSAEILDGDEFIVHQLRYGYPPEVIAAAKQTADRILLAVQQHAEPFGQASRRWLGQLPG